MPVLNSALFGAFVGAVIGLGGFFALGLVLGALNVFTNSQPMTLGEGIRAGIFFMGFMIGVPFGLPGGAILGGLIGTVLGFNELAKEEGPPRGELGGSPREEA